MGGYIFGLFIGGLLGLVYFFAKKRKQSRTHLSIIETHGERILQHPAPNYSIFDKSFRIGLAIFIILFFAIILSLPENDGFFFAELLRKSPLTLGWYVLSSNLTRPALWIGVAVGLLVSLWFYAAVFLDKTQALTAGVVGFIALGGTLMALDERYGFLEKLQSFEAAGTKLTFAAVSTSASDRRTPQFVSAQANGASQGVPGRFAYALATVQETNEAFSRDLTFAKMMLGMFRGGLRESDREEPRLDATLAQRTSYQQAIDDREEKWRSAQWEVTKRFDYNNNLFFFASLVMSPLIETQRALAPLFRSDHTTTLFNHDIIHNLHEIYREKYREFFCDSTQRRHSSPFSLAERPLQSRGRSTLEESFVCARSTHVEANSPNSVPIGTPENFVDRRAYRQTIIDSFRNKVLEHIQRVCLLQGMLSDTRLHPVVSHKDAGELRRNISFHSCAAAHAQLYNDWELFPSADTVYLPTIVAMAYFVVGLDDAALHVMEEWISHLDIQTMLDRLHVLRANNPQLLQQGDNEEMLSIAFRLAMYSRALHVISSISTFSHERSVIQAIRHAHAVRTMDRIMRESPAISTRLGRNFEKAFDFCSNQSASSHEEQNLKRVLLSQFGSLSRLYESAIAFDVARVSAYADFINVRAELLSSPERLRDCMENIRSPTGHRVFESDQVRPALLGFQVAYTRAILAGVRISTLAPQDRRKLLCDIGRTLNTLIAPIDLSLAVANPNNARERFGGLNILPISEENALQAAFRFDNERDARGLLASLRRESGSQREDFSDC